MEKIKPKSKVEIIEEVASFYNLNNRSVKPSEKYKDVEDCLFFGPNGKKCAVGKYLRPELEEDFIEGTRNADSVDVIDLDIELVPEVCHHTDNEFWQQLQHFHDNKLNWTQHGLSEKGEQKKIELLTTYGTENS